MTNSANFSTEKINRELADHKTDTEKEESLLSLVIRNTEDLIRPGVIPGVIHGFEAPSGVREINNSLPAVGSPMLPTI